MESKLAKYAERALLDAAEPLSPEQRVKAYLAHRRLVMQLHEAARKIRADAALAVPTGPANPR